MDRKTDRKRRRAPDAAGGPRWAPGSGLGRAVSAALVLGLAGLATTACTREAQVESEPSPEATRTEWRATISPQGADGHGGTATATVNASGTRVTVNLRSGSGGEHPWHVHRGTCGSGGGIVGAANAYPILEPDDMGDATATANISVRLSPGESYHVNIHQSPTQTGTIVGCGELRPA